jgi:Na+/H+-translocating membrane pyrophosphatase
MAADAYETASNIVVTILLASILGAPIKEIENRAVTTCQLVEGIFDTDWIPQIC